MLFQRLWLIAYRDLGRNWRRTTLTLIAVGLGLTLLIVLNGYIAGVLDDALQNSIRLQTGHLQIRAASYEEEQLSLQWPDLLLNPEELVARAAALGEVRAASPVLWAPGMLSTSAESVSLKLIGIDPTSSLHEPIQTAMVEGAFLTPDDREGIVIGKRLADSLGLAVGRRVSLTMGNADAEPDEGIFTIRGLFNTGVINYDSSAVFMPLSKAQAFARTGGRASAIVVALHRQADADNVATMLQSPGSVTLTWRDLNALFIQAMETGLRFYMILDGIVMLVVAVIIANTLLMAVFERIREMGILAALGMKGREIMALFLIEACILAVAGIALGVAFGSAGVAYLATVGIPLGEMATATEGIAFSSTVYARFVPGTFAGLAAGMLVIILLASLYPAWFAARLEVVEALRAG